MCARSLAQNNVRRFLRIRPLVPLQERASAIHYRLGVAFRAEEMSCLSILWLHDE